MSCLTSRYLSCRLLGILWPACLPQCEIVTESIVLAVSGGIIGLAISPVLIDTLASYAPDTTPPIMTATWMIIGFSFSVIIGSLAGLIPAIKAAKLDPIEALRYD